MMSTNAFVVGSCTRCNGAGKTRNTRQFFYGICLVASGMICFFHWPPTPELFASIGNAASRIGLPSWVSSTGIWLLTGLPPVFGISFLYAWFRGDTCPTCRGRGKMTATTTRVAIPTTRCAPVPMSAEPSAEVSEEPEPMVAGRR